MALKTLAVGLLGWGLAVSPSDACQGHVKADSSLADRQSTPCTSPKTPHRRSILPIERGTVFGVILVSVQVNGKPAALILDTGSSTTILSPEASGLDPIHLRRAEPPKKGSGFVGDGRWGEVTLITGARIWKDHRVLVLDMKSISDTMHRKIDGILGQDILDEFKCIEIDFEHRRLVLASD
jgi:hypothetical protein